MIVRAEAVGEVGVVVVDTWEIHTGRETMM
jgi:hypothetical protein